MKLKCIVRFQCLVILIHFNATFHKALKPEISDQFGHVKKHIVAWYLMELSDHIMFWRPPTAVSHTLYSHLQKSSIGSNWYAFFLLENSFKSSTQWFCPQNSTAPHPTSFQSRPSIRTSRGECQPCSEIYPTSPEDTLITKSKERGGAANVRNWLEFLLMAAFSVTMLLILLVTIIVVFGILLGLYYSVRCVSQC